MEENRVFLHTAAEGVHGDYTCTLSKFYFNCHVYTIVSFVSNFLVIFCARAFNYTLCQSFTDIAVLLIYIRGSTEITKKKV